MTLIKFLLTFFSFFCVDKFRLKFRELFSSCCFCCCKTTTRMKSSSMPFKSSGMLQHSPISTNNYRSSVKTNNPKRNNSIKILNTTSGVCGGQNINTVNSNTNNSNMTRHPTMNTYTHNGPICFRLTNV